MSPSELRLWNGCVQLFSRLQIHTLAEALNQYVDNLPNYEDADPEERERAVCAQAMFEMLEAKMAEAAEPKPQNPKCDSCMRDAGPGWETCADCRRPTCARCLVPPQTPQCKVCSERPENRQ